MGVGLICDPVGRWIAGGGTETATIGGFLYVTLASVGAGMTVSAVRWALIDRLHHATGIRRPNWNDALLDRKIPAFEYIVEQHYRYYQHYGNGLIAVLFTYGVWRFSMETTPNPLGVIDAGVLIIVLVFYAGSRDTLRHYYRRTSILLGQIESEVSNDERESSNRITKEASQKEDPGARRTEHDIRKEASGECEHGKVSHQDTQ